MTRDTFSSNRKTHLSWEVQQTQMIECHASTCIAAVLSRCLSVFVELLIPERSKVCAFLFSGNVVSFLHYEDDKAGWQYEPFYAEILAISKASYSNTWRQYRKQLISRARLWSCLFHKEARYVRSYFTETLFLSCTMRTTKQDGNVNRFTLTF